MTAPLDRTVMDDHRALDAGLERMVRIQMEAYPPHWTEAERRELAEKHLFGERRP